MAGHIQIMPRGTNADRTKTRLAVPDPARKRTRCCNNVQSSGTGMRQWLVSKWYILQAETLTKKQQTKGFLLDFTHISIQIRSITRFALFVPSSSLPVAVPGCCLYYIGNLHPPPSNTSHPSLDQNQTNSRP